MGVARLAPHGLGPLRPVAGFQPVERDMGKAPDIAGKPGAGACAGILRVEHEGVAPRRGGDPRAVKPGVAGADHEHVDRAGQGPGRFGLAPGCGVPPPGVGGKIRCENSVHPRVSRALLSR